MMNYALYPLIVAVFAFLNRARGSQLFTETDSTTEARLVSVSCMAIICLGMKMANPIQGVEIGAWTIAALMFWCVFAWDKYWGAAIGTNDAEAMQSSAFAPVDYIMYWIWPNPPSVTGISMRLWGWLAMSLRQSLAAIWVIGMAYLSGRPENSWLAIFTPALGTFYFIGGLLVPLPQNGQQTKAVMLAEYGVGAGLGILAILTLQ